MRLNMRKHYYCLLLLILPLFVCVINTYGQDITYSGNLKWKTDSSFFNGVKIIKLNFEGAIYHDSSRVIPDFSDRIKVSSTIANITSAELSYGNYEPIMDSIVAKSIKLNPVKDSIFIKYTFGKERKVNKLFFSMTPLRNNPKTGKLERLVDFKIIFHVQNALPNYALPVISKSGQTGNFTSQSLLSTGNWFKCTVSKSGIYKLTYSQLKTLGIAKPEDVRIYGNGGKVLNEIYSGNIPDDLQEIPIMMESGADAIFNDGDDILFYAEGPVTWDYDSINKIYLHNTNPYTDDIVYFITEKSGGKHISASVSTTGASNIQVSSFDGLDVYEKNNFNLISSGSTWLSDKFGVQNSKDYTFSFPGIITSEPILLESDLYARSSTSSNFQIKYNGQLAKNAQLAPVDVLSSEGNYASKLSTSTSFSANSNNITISLSFLNNGNTDAFGFLDFMRLTVRQSLTFANNQLIFRDKKSVGVGNIASFNISGVNGHVLVWDITKINQVKGISGSIQSNVFVFNAAADNLKTYIAFDPQNAIPSPTIVSTPAKVENQNLHGLSNKPFIIITHPDFLVQAQKLADLHLQHENMQSMVVTTDQIYNEFSSGMPDPAAIRNFVKMFYDRATTESEIPRYLLLFGDGSYDNKSVTLPNETHNSNYILTYESANSISQTGSYVSDDYFGMLDDNEKIEKGMLDIGVGRIPVQNPLYTNGVDQAANVVAKIERYMNKKNAGNWHNSICFIADAGDNNTHVNQADELAIFVTKQHPNFNIKKVYVDAFSLESTSSGLLCPLANKAIANYLNNGLLILNYTGHGSERGLSKQQIMQQNGDIKVWKNNYLPLFVTATCEISRYDDCNQTTAGEDILLNPNGGGIALLTTTRVVYSQQNFELNGNFYKYCFNQSEDNPEYKLGDINRLTKNATTIDVNKLNFSLLGDPALSLAIPKYSVATDSINHNSIIISDTLKAYSNVSIKGHITDIAGDPITNYNGIVYPTIYDKVKNLNTLGNFDGGSYKFTLQDNVLFRGKASVKNGKFDINFVMPRDIDYNFGNGKISYYATDSINDCSGLFNEITIGGLSLTIAETDTTGPSIKLFMNDSTFIDGGLTDAYPTLLAKVADMNGLNPGGNSIGHDIVAILDNDSKSVITLNNYFETEIDNFRKGTVSYKFNNITPGKHNIEFKIWDIFNNSYKSSINFNVLGSNEPNIQNVYNYPNPFYDGTTFFFEHNLSGESLETNIEIYNLSGKKIYDLKRFIIPEGYTSGPIEWDGNDAGGNKLSRGIYFYRVRLRYQSNEIVSKTQKMIVIN